jgi:hypothetical protein
MSFRYAIPECSINRTYRVSMKPLVCKGLPSLFLSAIIKVTSKTEREKKDND